jgi:hypothetical protein
MEQTHEEEHTYEELESPSSIRVLELLPGAHGTSLTCNLFQARREDNPEYEAVSYAWGAPVFSKRIQELSTEKYICITENLFDALESFRYEDRSRILWVDAVCINQRDNKEKNHQVAQMAEIYRDSTVLVWLGKDDAAQAFRCLRKLATQYLTMEGIEDRDRAQRNTPRASRLDVYQGGLIDGRDRNALVQLFQRDWFRRVWIVQEVALAKIVTVFAGADCLDWINLHRAVTTLRYFIYVAYTTCGVTDLEAITAYTAVYRIVQIRPYRHGHPQDCIPLSLLQYCNNFADAACSKDRDRVYAFLGLANDDLSILPDYDCPENLIWKELALRSLNRGDLYVLHCSGLAHKKHAGGMSFVPNILSIRSARGGFSRRPPSKTFRSRLDCPGQSQVLDGDRVRLSGLFVDVVPEPFGQQESDSNTPISTQPINIQELHEVCAQISALCPRPYSHSLASVFARVVVEDNFISAFDNSSSEELQFLLTLSSRAKVLADGSWAMPLEKYDAVKGGVRVWLKSLDGSLCSYTIEHKPQVNGVVYVEMDDDGTRWALVDKRLVELAAMFCKEHRHYVLRYRMFFTAKGYIGKGPKCMEPGDVVVIFDGAQTPFVLRPIPREPDGDGRPAEYQLVGDCYLEGWMKGDLFGHKVVDDAGETLPATDGIGKDKSKGTDTPAAKSNRLSRIHAKATRVGFSLRGRLGKNKSNGQQMNSERKVLKHTSFILR